MANPFDFLDWLKKGTDTKSKMTASEAERRKTAQQAAKKPLNLDFLNPSVNKSPAASTFKNTNLGLPMLDSLKPKPEPKGFSKFNSSSKVQEKKPTTPAPKKQNADTYKVVKGDYLIKIADKLGVDDWHDIYKANKDVIGKNPDLIFPDQEFKIPHQTLSKADNSKSKSLVEDFNNWQGQQSNKGSFLDNIKQKKAQEQGQYDFGWIDDYQFPSQKKGSFLDNIKQRKGQGDHDSSWIMDYTPPSQRNQEATNMTPEEAQRRSTAQKNQTAMDKRVSEVDKKLIKAGLPKSSELPKGLSADFAVKNPGFTKFMMKVTEPVRDVLEDTAAGKFITRTGQTGGDIATSGASAIGRDQKATTGNKVADTIADVIGGLTGFAANPGGAQSMLNIGTAAGKVTQKGFDNLTKGIQPTSKLGQKSLDLGSMAAKGIGEGIPFATASQLGDLNDKDLSQRAKEFIIDTAIGGLIEPAGSIAAAGIKRLADRFRKGEITQQQFEQAVQETVPQSKDRAQIKGLNFSSLPKAKLNLPKIEPNLNQTKGIENFLSSLPKPQQKMETGFKNEIDGMLDDIFGPSKKQAASTAEPKAQVFSTNMLSAPPLQSKNAPSQRSLDDLLPDIGNADTFRNKINRNPKEKKPFKEFVEKFRTQFIDDLAPLEKLEKNMLGSLQSAENSLYKKARLFRGSPAKAHEIVRTRLAPIIQSVENKGYSYKDLGDYALAVHAKDVNNMGIKSGFTSKEIDAVIQKYGTPEMEAARQQLMRLSGDMLNTLADSGVISKNLVDHLQQKYPNYMPLFRSFDDDKVEFAGALSESLANVTNPLKRLKGSERDVIDPLESMVKNIFQATNTSDRNQVARQLASLADQDVDGNFVRRLAPGEKEGRKNVVSVLENGERIKFEVQPDVYRAMLALDKESAGMIVNFLSKPASLLRAGATLTPEFSLRNWMRDVPTAYIVSQSGFNPFTDFPVAMLETIFKDKPIHLFGKQVSSGQLYNQFIKDNAGYGNIVSMDRKVHQEALQRVLKEPTSKKFINIVSPKKWIEVLQAIADVSETATKMGEYRAALRKGTSREEAAYRARDIMDFARAGSGVRNWNKMTAFLNANIQGKSKILRAAAENPASVTVKALTAITLPTIAVKLAQEHLANDQQKETIKDAPAWLKNSFWLVPVPGTDQVARIPKPFDLAPIFANLPERVMDYVIENDKNAFDGFARESLGSLSVPVMMTGLTPVVEGFANYSFFRQGPIIPMREERLNYPDQYDVNTSEVAKIVGKGVDTLTDGQGAFKNFGSPRIIDNTIRGLGGGLAGYTTDGIDGLLNIFGMVKKGPESADKTIDQSPFAKAFLVNQSQGGASLDRLYDERDRLRRAEGSAKMRDGQLSPEEKRNLKYIEKVLDGISKINNQIREIENHPTMNGAEKQRRLEELYKKRQEIARGASGKLGW